MRIDRAIGARLSRAALDPRRMTIHLQKLSVGSESIQTLQDWQDIVVARRVQQGESAHHVHVTRMTPKRAEELLNGGSRYWVIKGLIQCRNEIAGLERVHTADGRKACAILMEPKLIPVIPVPKRAFQGWRYLKPEDAPIDLEGAKGAKDRPPHIRAQLVEIGAW